MSKKALIFGLLLAILASSVGGAFTAIQARADYIAGYPILTCNPAVQSVNSGDLVQFSALYAQANNAYYPSQTPAWQATGGSPSTGTGNYFSTRFYSIGTETRIISVTDGYQTATCTVYVNGSTPTPSPTQISSPVQVNHAVRNITRGGEGYSVNAYNGDRVQYVVRLTTGNSYAYDVRVRDWMPQYVSYVSGSTKLDNAWLADGVINDSINLGTLANNRTYTLTFDGIVTGAPISTLTNTVNAHVSGYQDVSLTSVVSVISPAYTYTPTPYPTVYPTPSYIALTVTEFGRNITRGQATERSSVTARGNDTIDIIVHLRGKASVTQFNVFLTDILPSGLNYIPSSTTVNGIVAADGITSSGLNIGSITPNQEIIVKFSAVVDANTVPVWGQTQIRNTTQVRADNTGTLTVQLPIILTNAATGNISQVQTGPEDSILLALGVGVLMTLMYAAYTQTSLFGRRLALAEIKQVMSKKDQNFIV